MKQGRTPLAPIIFLGRVAVLASIPLGIALGACSADDRAGAASQSKAVGGGQSTPPTACADGASKACTETIGQHNGILTCYDGTSTCVGGVWGPCSDGTVTTKLSTGSPPTLPSGPGMTPLAITAATPCEDNPCDPSCMSFVEEPDVVPVPSTGTGSGSADFVGGSLSSLPPGLVKGKGIIEPCEWGAHCQFNHHCTDVATDASCPHSKCTIGTALAGECMAEDPCVAAICAADASCCSATCVHDPCVVGTKLAKSCNPCVQSICAAIPECCNDEWSSECVAAIATACPSSTCECAAGDGSFNGHCYRYFPPALDERWSNAVTACGKVGVGWNLTAVSSSDENTFVRDFLSGTSLSMWIGLNYVNSSWDWSNGEPVAYTAWTGGAAPTGNHEDCVVTSAAANSWDDARCTVQKPFLCEGSGTVLTSTGTSTAWDQGCVDLVATVCDATCGATGKGTCEPWLTGEVDPTCNGIDLALAVPCDGLVPVCNHGLLEAPAHIPLVHYPGNSPQYGVCDPVAESKMVECETLEPIPPGECIMVDCDLWSVGVGSNRQIYVNPPGYAGSLDECSCLDNWTEAHKGTACGPPPCAEAVSEASLEPLNMFILVDKSGSMGYCKKPSKWTAGTNALKAFFESEFSGGISVAMEFFPLAVNEAASGDDGCGPACAAANCQNPLIPLGTLTSDPRPADAQEQDLVYWLQQVCPGGMTPTYPALDGALAWSIAHKSAHPEENHVVVLMTDGEPTQCEEDTGLIAALASAAFGSHGIRTYTIGMDGANFTLLDAVAQAGGTGKAIAVDDADPANVEELLVAAFYAIAGNAMSCEFLLPDVGQYDPNNVSVTFVPGTGDPVELDKSPTSGSGCDWYFDDDAAPTKITLCAAACQAAQQDPLGRIQVYLGCPVEYAPAEATQVYEGSCPPGAHVQWGFFTYESSTPDDSYVAFAARTAQTEAGLTGAFTNIATAQATPDTQLCPMSGVPDCPLDLVEKLGIPAAFAPVIEVKASLFPSTTGTTYPTVQDWQITYSCPATE